MAKTKITKPGKRKLNAEQKAAKKLSEKLLRADLVKLRKSGVAFQGHNIGGRKLTKYEAGKVRKLRPILSGDLVFLPMSPKERRKYRRGDDVKAATKTGLVVPKGKEGEYETILHGMRAKVQPLSDGTTIVRIQPTKSSKYREVMEWLSSPEADDAKLPDDQFGFIFQDHRSARIFYQAKDLWEWLSRYVKDEELEEIENGEREEPNVYLYRIYPPDDWYALVKQESQEQIEEFVAEMKGLKGWEKKRLAEAIQRKRQKIGQTPRKINVTSSSKAQAFAEKEATRWRKRMAKDAARRAKRRADRERQRAKRKAKREGK